MEASWNVFERVRDGGRCLVVAVDVDPEERRKRPVAVVLDLPYEPRPDGLPLPGELDKTNRLEDAVENLLSPLGGLSVGHVTGQGRVRAVFYMPSRDLPPLAVKAGLFKKVVLTPDLRDDPEWSVYETVLAPNPTERQISRDRVLLQTLARHGDLHERPRPVDFTLFFPTAAGRDLLMPIAVGEGWRLAEEGTWETDTGEYGVQLTKDTPVLPDVIAAECVRLQELAEPHGGEFDGWACPVVNA